MMESSVEASQTTGVSNPKPALAPKPRLAPKPFSLQTNTTIRSIHAPKSATATPHSWKAEAATVPKPALPAAPLKPSTSVSAAAKEQGKATKETTSQPGHDVSDRKSDGVPQTAVAKESAPLEKGDSKDDNQKTPADITTKLEQRDEKKNDETAAHDMEKLEEGGSSLANPAHRWGSTRKRLSMELTSKFESGGGPPPVPSNITKHTTSTKHDVTKAESVNPEQNRTTPELPDREVGDCGPKEDYGGGGSIKRRISQLFESRPEVTFKREEPEMMNGTGGVKARIKNWAMETVSETKPQVVPQPGSKSNQTSAPTPAEKTPETPPAEPPSSSQVVDVPLPVKQATDMGTSHVENRLTGDGHPVIHSQTADHADETDSDGNGVKRDGTKRRSVHFGVVEKDDGGPPVVLGSDSDSSSEDEEKQRREDAEGDSSVSVPIYKRAGLFQKDSVDKLEAEQLHQLEFEKNRREQEAEEATQTLEELRRKEEEEEKEKQSERQRQLERLRDEEKQRLEREQERVRLEEMKREKERLQQEDLDRKRKELERIKLEEEEKEKLREEEMERQRKELERLRLEEEQREQERLRQEMERERKELERIRLEEKEKERLRQDEMERQRKELEKMKLEEEKEKGRMRQEIERQRKELERMRLEEEEKEKERVRQEMERQRKELERMRLEEEKERMRQEEMERQRNELEQMRLEKEENEKERLRQEMERQRKELEQMRLEKEENEKERLRQEMERESNELVRFRMEEEERENERMKQKEMERHRKELERIMMQEEGKEKERLEQEEMERHRKEWERVRWEEEHREKESIKKEEMERERRIHQLLHRQREEEREMMNQKEEDIEQGDRESERVWAERKRQGPREEEERVIHESDEHKQESKLREEEVNEEKQREEEWENHWVSKVEKLREENREEEDLRLMGQSGKEEEEREKCTRLREEQEMERRQKENGRQMEKARAQEDMLISFDSDEAPSKSSYSPSRPPLEPREANLDVLYEDFSIKKNLLQVEFDDFSVKPMKWGTHLRDEGGADLQGEGTDPSRGEEEEEEQQEEEEVVVDASAFKWEYRGRERMETTDTIEPAPAPEREEENEQLISFSTEITSPSIGQEEPEKEEEKEEDAYDIRDDVSEEAEDDSCANVEEKGTDVLIDSVPDELSEASEQASETGSPNPDSDQHLEISSEDFDTTDFHSEADIALFPESSTPLLDSSAQKSKADLSKRRSRTRPSRSLRTGLAHNESPDWRTSDSSELSSKQRESDSEDEQPRQKIFSPHPSSQRVPIFPGLSPAALIAQIKRKTGGRGEETEVDHGEGAKEEGAAPSPAQLSSSPRTAAHLAGAARVLPPIAGTGDGAAACPPWLQELKSKKRLSQYDSEP